MSPAANDIGAAQGATERRARRTIRRAELAPYASAAIGLLTIALIWIGVYHNVSREYAQDERAAMQTADNLARSFEEQIIRSIRAVDQTLLYVRRSYVRSKGTLDLPTWSREGQFLADFTFQVAIIDRDGILVGSSMGFPEGMDLGDREHFQVHALRDSDELFISKPLLGRVSKRWSIQLTRRINAEDGSFGGVVVVSLDPSYLSDFYGSIDIGRKGTITLVGADGIIRARGPGSGHNIGMAMNATLLMQHFAGSAAGSFSGRSGLDGVERIFNYRQVKGYPLIIAVGLARDEVFVSSSKSRTSYLLAAAMVTVLLGGAHVLIMRYQRGLALARDAAEAGTRARSEFLAVMSHEIRTPLNAVLGFASTLLESKLSTEQRLNVTALHGAGDDLLRLLNDILDFSALDARRIRFEDVLFSPAALVEMIASIAGRGATAKGLTLRIDVGPDVPAVLRGDAGRLRQVLLNLLINAIKFTERGHIVVELRWLGGTAKNATVQWSVTDTGVGIAADRIGHVFAGFAQADASFNRSFGGPGLGLAICKRIIDQLDGRISATSVLGRGSSFMFSVTLPLGEPFVEAEGNAGNAIAELKSHIAGLGRPLRVLLAEDNPTNQLVGKQLLREFDANVSVASNGSEAVQLAGGFSYDVLLMDMQMPEMSGIEATQAIRARGGAHAQVSIVALTANTSPEDVQACLDAGMNGFVAKPVRKSALAEAILRSLTGAPAVPILAPPAPGRVTEAAIVDPAAVDEFIAQVGCESTDEILAVFLVETERRLDLLRGLSIDDRDAIRQEVHTLKGSSGTFGLMRLSALARDLERRAAGITPADYRVALIELDSIFAASRRELNDYLKNIAENCAAFAE